MSDNKQELLNNFKRSEVITHKIIDLIDQEKDHVIFYLGILLAQKTVKQGLIASGVLELSIKELDDFLDMQLGEVLDKRPEFKNLDAFAKYLNKEKEVK